MLIAEDEPIVRLDLAALLRESGFDVCAEARDGDEAVALAREHRPDAANKDVRMPGGDGGGFSWGHRGGESWGGAGGAPAGDDGQARAPEPQ